MPSPFPGMDPYFEQSGQWHSFHAQYVIQLARTAAAVLPQGYHADNEMMLFIHEPSAKRRRLAGVADDAVSVGTCGRGAGPAGAVACDEPKRRVRYGDQVLAEKHRFVQVLTNANRRVVSVIEVLSPTNKGKAADRQTYLAKREELVRDGVHFLQIDLLRGGRHMLPEAPSTRGQLNAMLVRAGQGEAELWDWSLRDRLPTLPVPLLEGDADVPLDLRGAMDVVYDAMRYGSFIYEEPPEPPLVGDDAAWAAAILQQAGVDAA